MANNYEIDYNDKRFTQVEQDKKTALSDLEKTYTGMIDKSDKYYQDQIDAAEDWKDEQTKLQNAQTDFTIQKIEQQKEQAQKDYIKEQSGAYVDWRKQSNEYGAEAEKMASAGLQRTGYSESSQVAMYNAYQNRVAMAKASIDQAMVNYNNSITEAQLQNSTVLAEIAYQTLQTTLKLALDQFNHKNQLILEKANKKTELENVYYSRYQDVLAQINHENALAEQIRQYNASLAEERRQYNASLAQQQAELAFQKQKYSDEKAAKSVAISKQRGSTGGAAFAKSVKAPAKKTDSSTALKNYQNQKHQQTSAYAYLNALIASGASKDKVANEIAIARREGAITAAQAKKLQDTFTPRGVQY